MPVREPRARKGLPDKVGRRAYPARRATLETRDLNSYGGRLKANKRTLGEKGDTGAMGMEGYSRRTGSCR